MDHERVRLVTLVAACVIGVVALGRHELEVGAFDAWSIGTDQHSSLDAADASPQDTLRAGVRIPDRWVAGFVNDIVGEIIAYPSAYPGQTRALLTRATDGAKRIEWEADRPPNGEAAPEVVHFVWHAGLASGYGAHRFTLSVNGTRLVTFTSGRDTNDREWMVKGEEGASLAFKTTQIGNFNELFGLMVLSVPRHLLAPGRPRISVVGEAAGNQDYYMTFLRPVEDWARVAGEQAVLKGGRRALRVEVSHIGNESDARLLADELTIWTGRVGAAYTSLFLPAPPGAQQRIRLEIGGRAVFSGVVSLAEPVRHWELRLLPHSHVDIGYSDPQPEVERKQWQNLDAAVALAAKTAAYPPGSRFKWNVEGLWSVESYLRQASAGQRARFLEAVKSGAIGLQANYTNILTGLASPEELTHWTDAARRLTAEYSLPPIRSAMHTDIPGLSWTSVRALSEGGVRYFSSGPNYMPSLPDRGDRIGRTLDALGDRPFWWASPSGNERVLFWMAGRGYSWFHGLNMGSASRAGRLPLLDYVAELHASGYPWDMIQVRYTIGGDNGPVDPQLPDFVKAWNETFEWPRLAINTAEEMFEEFERRHGATLPTLTGDMTPYWEDGAISTAAEESLVRASARRLVQAETAWCLRDPAKFPSADAADAWRNVLLWHEHTWGAADSVSQPDRAEVLAQWTYKRQFALEADRRSKALLEQALEIERRPTFGTTLREPSERYVDIINTLSWPRKGLVVLDAQATKDRDRARARTGRILPSQRLSDGRLGVLVDNVTPFATTRVGIERGTAVSPRAWAARITGNAIDNGIVRVVLDETTGRISSLRLMETALPASTAPARAGSFDAVDRAARAGAAGGEHPVDLAFPGTGLNGYLYVPGRDPGEARPAGRSRIVVEEPGPLVATLRVESEAPGARSLVSRVTLVAGEPNVHVEDVLDKLAVRAKESAHVAFPFHVPGATIRVDEGAAAIVPERDQLDGSCRDFIGVHSAVDIRNADVGIALATLDAPLVEIGAITDERQDPRSRVRTWPRTTTPGSTVYAYLLNNYWHTNYKADQEGRLAFRFVLRPHAGEKRAGTTRREMGTAARPFDAVSLRRFSEDNEQPLLVRPVAAGSPILAAPFKVDSSDLVVSSVRCERERAAFLLRLYNPSEREARARIVPSSAGATIAVEVAYRDRKTTRAAGGGRIVLKPFATALVRVTPAKRQRPGTKRTGAASSQQGAQSPRATPNRGLSLR